ncbi:uncharacterized protein LOC120661062 [Panicum virgatum]|uniref:uncharacterized protein LOC120661062 n=1 Tax=Panicum virgatum TaxID=38727 RepID=UPI0019D6A39E|nr:uncharacterized protein LOC120661062 [Panicum virgatum]
MHSHRGKNKRQDLRKKKMGGPNDQASQIASVLGNIEQLNGSNYASWKEKLEVTLALLDIDYALHKDPPVEPKPEDENYEVLKKEYDEEKTKWSVSNRKCIMIIRSSIIDTIRGAIPDTQSVRDYLTKIEVGG